MLTQNEYKRQQFIQKLVIATDRGFDPNILLTQSTLETGHFSSYLCDKFNFFGIKWYKKCNHEGTDADTFEIINGVKRYIKDRFVIFADCSDGITFYCQLIEAYHPKSWATRGNYKEYFKNIASWSTSPDYTKTLTELYEEMLWEGKLLKWKD